MTRVLLVDDQALVRAGFRALLDAEPDIEVVGEAGDGNQRAVHSRPSSGPDVVLKDIRMPEIDGLEATAQITSDPGPPTSASSSSPRLISTSTSSRRCAWALAGLPRARTRAGRPVPRGPAVARPATPCCRPATRLADRESQPEAVRGSRTGLDELTEREREVITPRVRLSNDGDRRGARHQSDDREDARQPGHDEARRLGSAQLVVFAYESGLVRPGWLA